MDHDARGVSLVAILLIGLALTTLPLPTSARGFRLDPTPFLAPAEGFGAGGASTSAQITRERPSSLQLEPRIPLLPPFPRRVGGDLLAVVRAPLDWERGDWGRLGLAALAVGTVAVFDEQIDGWLDDNRSPDAVRVAKTIRPLGQECLLVALGATWLAGRHLDRPDLVAVSQDSLEAAIIAAGVITPLLKAVTARSRPRFSSDASAFGAGGQSFPSGETTLAFAVASVVAAHADSRWVDATAWGAAALVGLQRMTLDAHWASDVAAGALIGAAVGRWVVRRHAPERAWSRRVVISPNLSPGGIGVTVGMRF